MSLTNKQKKLIKKNVSNTTLNELSKITNIDSQEILDYLKKIWREEKYKNYLEKNSDKKTNSKVTFLDKFLNSNWAYFVLIVVPFVVYLFGLFGQFVSDDVVAIQQNTRLTEASWIFRQPLYFLRDIFYAIIFTVVGKTAFFYRLLNLIFHIGSVVLIFIILKKLTNNYVAFFTSLLFAVHPIAIEGVTWISGGPYAQYTFFFLLSFYYYIKEGAKNYYLSLFFFILCLLSSEKSFVLSGVYLVYEFTYNNKDFKRNYKLALPFLGLGFLWTIYYAFRLNNRFSILQNQYYQVGGKTDPIVSIPLSLTKYFELLTFPKDLTLYHTKFNLSVPARIFQVFVFLVYTASLFWALVKKKYIYLFWASFFIIPLLPFILPIGVAWVVAERYIYASSIGFFVICSYGIYYLLQKYSKYQKLVFSLFLLLVFMFSIRTAYRNYSWTNQDRLWEKTVQASPNSPKAWNNIGDTYGKRGQHDESIKAFQNATKLNPNFADAYHNLGNAYTSAGEVDLAVQSYKKALSINPNIWQSHYNLALIYMEKSDYKTSNQYLENTLKLVGPNIDIYIYLGNNYKQLEDTDKAREYYQKALNLDFTNIKAQRALNSLNENN